MIMILPFIGESSRMGGVKTGENIKFAVAHYHKKRDVMIQSAIHFAN